MKTCSVLLFVLAFASCGEKKEEGPDNTAFMPVASIIRSQVNDVDTNLYNIVKIVTVNDRSDTTHIKREEFRKHAEDFLSLPDLTQKKWKGDYDESNFYDDALGSVVLSYTARDADLETRKEELLVDPNPEGDSKVRTIIAEKISEKSGASIRKNMIWHIDKRFQVITATTNKNGQETIEKVQVIWNASVE